MRVGGQGEILFFNAKTGVELKRVALPLPAGSEIRSIAQDQPGSPTVALGLSNGQVLVFQHTYKVTYPDNKKTITPEIAFPYGETPIGLDPQGRPLEHVSINAGDDSLLLAGSVDKQLLLLSMTREENMLTGESTLDEERIELPQIAEPVKAIYLDPRKQWLYVINGRATADVFDLHSRQLNGRYKLLEDPNAEVTASTSCWAASRCWWATPRVASPSGSWLAIPTANRACRTFVTSTWMARRSAPSLRNNGARASSPWTRRQPRRLPQHRAPYPAGPAGRRLFRGHHPVAAGQPPAAGAGWQDPPLRPEQPAPGNLLERALGQGLVRELRQAGLRLAVHRRDHRLRTEAEPLAADLGTLKAAFYAMILAAPLAIAAAVYTAYFMAPAMRRKVKPVIELMEALPTVILASSPACSWHPTSKATCRGCSACCC